MNNKHELTELYGAITALRMMIKGIEETPENKTLPGTDYLVEKLKDVCNEINLEIAQTFNGIIVNLQDAIKDIEDET